MRRLLIAGEVYRPWDKTRNQGKRPYLVSIRLSESTRRTELSDGLYEPVLGIKRALSDIDPRELGLYVQLAEKLVVGRLMHLAIRFLFSKKVTRPFVPDTFATSVELFRKTTRLDTGESVIEIVVVPAESVIEERVLCAESV